MDYEKMWHELKTEVEKELEYHKSGKMQSIYESVQGAVECEQILAYMEQLEERHQQ